MPCRRWRADYMIALSPAKDRAEHSMGDLPSGYRSCSMVIHSVPPVVQGVLDLLRLGAVFNLAESESAAEALAAGGAA